MLVLTRKLQETIRIGDHITLTVLRVKGNTVRLGIDAPREVRVVRAELPPKELSPPATVAAMPAQAAAAEEENAADEPTPDASQGEGLADPAGSAVHLTRAAALDRLQLHAV